MKGCREVQVNVPLWPCRSSTPETSSASQAGEEGPASRHVASVCWQASGKLQVQFSLMLVLETSRVPGTTCSTSAQEALQYGHFLSFPSTFACSKKPFRDDSVVQTQSRSNSQFVIFEFKKRMFNENL